MEGHKKSSKTRITVNVYKLNKILGHIADIDIAYREENKSGINYSSDARLQSVL